MTGIQTIDFETNQHVIPEGLEDLLNVTISRHRENFWTFTGPEDR